MFELLKNPRMVGLAGFAITLEGGRRIEVDFGPMSQSERKNSSRKEFDHNPKSMTAEVRLYEDGQNKPSEHYVNMTPNEFATWLGGY